MKIRGGCRTAGTSKNGALCDKAVNYYHKELHLGCCSSPRSASGRVYVVAIGDDLDYFYFNPLSDSVGLI